ncbi:MAG: hypothetical protein HY718_04335 [Planctomycetes bacterium]|nr:hypothetical protein [Planctomycetota bacterium]
MFAARKIARTALPAMLAGLVLATGCQAPAEPAGPTVARVTIDSPDAYEALWQTADNTLRRYWLAPDRQDRVAGVMVSRAETTAAWFEFWRPQPKPAYAWWESNLHAVRRQATIHIEPQQKPEYEISVQVDRFQYSLEERQVDRAAGTLRLYSDVAPTASGRLEKPSQTGRWLPLGRDGEMEHDILQDILQHYGSGEMVTSPPTSTQPAGTAG